MGLFKQMKDMKDAVKAAPALVDQAQQMAASAQQYQAQAMSQQQSVMGQAVAHQMAASGQLQPQTGGLDPIAGVDLHRYAAIVRAIAPHGYDQSLLPGIAASHGIAAHDWQQAHDGWNARIQSDPAVARAFSDAYRSI
jgi:hypothetical protein